MVIISCPRIVSCPSWLRPNGSNPPSSESCCADVSLFHRSDDVYVSKESYFLGSCLSGVSDLGMHFYCLADTEIFLKFSCKSSLCLTVCKGWLHIELGFFKCMWNVCHLSLTRFLCSIFFRDMKKVGVTIVGPQKKLISSIKSLEMHTKNSPVPV